VQTNAGAYAPTHDRSLRSGASALQAGDDAKNSRRHRAPQEQEEEWIELADGPPGDEVDAAEAGDPDDADAEEVESAPGLPWYDAEDDPKYARIEAMVADPESEIGRLADRVNAQEADYEDLLRSVGGGNPWEAEMLRSRLTFALGELKRGALRGADPVEAMSSKAPA